MFGRILTAMVTPFGPDGEVDWKAAAGLMRHLVATGSDGLVLAGTTGEASTLTDDEKVGLYRLAMEEVGDRATVVAGTGSNDTAHSVHLTEKARQLGCHAVLAVTPYYNRPPREGVIGHFRAMAEVGVPVIAYNIPGRTALNMPPDLLAELSRIPHVVAVKQANEDVAQTEELRRLAPDMALYAGNDDLLLPFLRMGGQGVISVVSHLTAARQHAICDAMAAGADDEAEAVDESLRDLYAALFVTTNPILIKAALEMAGLIPSAAMRLPLVEASPVQKDILRTVLEQQGVLAGVR